jgi:probable rRNA maturation factor
VSLIVDVSAENVRAPLSRTRIRDVAIAVLEAERVRDAMVSITLVTRQHIARLNRRHLGHTGPTDVISFSLGALPGAGAGRAIVGDVYIAPDVARANAKALGTGVRDEIARLVVHGTLHVLGHDHPDGDDRTTSAMWRRQEQLLARVNRAATSNGRAR